MKIPAFKYSLTALLLVFFISAAFGQVEKTKEVKRTFQTSPSTKLSIENRYGKVHIDTWDKNEIDLHIVVTVERRSPSRAEEILDKIDFDISESSSLVSIETKINGTINSSRNESFRIDYKVSMPKANPLYVSNKYGAFYLDDFDGKLELEIKYGSMKVENVSAKSYIQLAYGSGQVESLNNGEIDISYSKFRAYNMGNMEIFSKYSNATIEKMGDVYLENKYGNLSIGEAIGIEGETKYGGVSVDKLSKRLIMEAKYGDGVDVDWISNDFETVQLESGYCSSTLKFQEGFSADFSGYFKYCSLRYPEDDFDFRTIHEGNHSSEYSGVLGKGNGNSKIKINSEYGDVRIYYAN